MFFNFLSKFNLSSTDFKVPSGEFILSADEYITPLGVFNVPSG
jgi:hypothetical protein